VVKFLGTNTTDQLVIKAADYIVPQGFEAANNGGASLYTGVAYLVTSKNQAGITGRWPSGPTVGTGYDTYFTVAYLGDDRSTPI
jgi:hypothetical protein